MQLAALASIRGDAAAASRLAAAAALPQIGHVRTNDDLKALLAASLSSIPRELRHDLAHIHAVGGWVAVETAIADLPADLRWLFESAAVTLEQLAVLHRALGVTSAADLAAAAERQSVRSVPGFDARTERAILAALPGLRASSPRIPLGQAVATSDRLLDLLRARDDVEWALPVGSLRRGQETIGDVELVVRTSNARPVLDHVAGLDGVTHLRHRSAERIYIFVDRMQIGVRCPPPDIAGATLLYLTGSRSHVSAIQRVAAERGMLLRPDGLQLRHEQRVLGASEAEIYDALDLPFIPPELRNDDGDEIEAARENRLPQLVERTDVLGDLHMHSNWSDGRDSIEAMVQASVGLGYEYIAITDHSPSSVASRSLTLEDIERQANEIAMLRERYPQIAILHGCEVDILVDGRLDLPERTLKRFDLVLASLHEHAGQPPDQLLRRYLRAMLHPLVSIVTHPANRLFPHRPGYPLAFDRLFEAAAETRTLLEIDGAPSHLDLDFSMARRAAALGATLVIDSDAHRADALDRHMRLGVLTARRGWVEKRHVLNTQPLRELRALVAAKRRGARR